MPRHDRARFLAFGLGSLANVVALLLYGLGLATHGRGGAAASLPVLVILAAGMLLVSVWTSIKRGHDLGWPALATTAACTVAFATGPAIIALAGYLAWAKGQPADNKFGQPPPRASVSTWLTAAMLIALPWAGLAVSARILA